MKVNFILQPFDFYKNSGPYTYLSEVMPLLRKRGVDVAVNEKHGCDIVHVNDIFPHSFLSRIRRKPMIATAHAVPSKMRGLSPKIFDNYWNFYLKYFYNLFDKVIAISPHSLEEIKNIGVKKEKIEYLMHGINLEKFKPDKNKRKILREKMGIGKNETVIFNSSRIEPRKGIFEFISVANSFPEYKFVWFGKLPNILTPDYFKISKIVKTPPKNVLFTGKIENVVDAYNAGDIFFFPSIGESFGFSVIEAAACGKPVLLKDISDFKIFDFAIKYKSQEQCIKKIEMLLDEKIYNCYRDLTLKKVKEFDINKHVQGLVEIYETLV
jgi:glycosyltransferase involved in cell wall biosynthesis